MSILKSVLYSEKHYAVSVVIQVKRGADYSMSVCRTYDSADSSSSHMWDNLRKDILHVAKNNGGTQTVRVMVNNHGKFQFVDFTVEWAAEYTEVNDIRVFPVLYSEKDYL